MVLAARGHHGSKLKLPAWDRFSLVLGDTHGIYMSTVTVQICLPADKKIKA
jgi:hypothetical protein